jgi:signal transduction histidine kinase
LGQAIVSYEVFTGKTLPRRGLVRQWRQAIGLAAGYGLGVGLSLTLHARPIYTLLATAILMTLFYALLSRRSFAERERYIEHLRPFVASQRLYERLLSLEASTTPDAEVQALFAALCDDVLGAGLAYLVPLGPLTPLIGSALTYPGGEWGAPPPLPEIVAQAPTPGTICLALDPDRCGGAAWAVPLWGERGLIGVLLLGEKRDGGLYTQEEIEIARASGERLMDTLASAQMARRLMALQRQRLAESRDFGELSRAVFDQRARRLLHDDVLPLLHTAMLTLSAADGLPGGAADEVQASLAAAHRQISDLLREMPTAATPEVARLGLVGALQALVDSELDGDFEQVAWQIEPGAARRAEAMPDLIAEVLYGAAREALRNAARHGRPADRGPALHLQVALNWQEEPAGSGQGRLVLLVEDDGQGLAASASTAGGSGQGLALHSTMMAVVGGTLSIEGQAGLGSRVLLSLPLDPSP